MRTLGIDGRNLNRSSRTPFAECARHNPLSRRVFSSDARIAVTTAFTITYDHLDRAGSRSAHLLGTLGDKSGVEQMRRDLKEFAPADGVSPAPEPDDPNATATAIREGKGGKNHLLREALIIAEVLAELGDHSGYQLAARAALEGQMAVVRTQAVFALVEIAKADKKVLSKAGIDPVSVLCKVAASEQDPVPFGVLIGTSQKLHPDAAIRVLEKAKDSARQSALNRQAAEIALARVKGKKSPPK